MNHWCSFSFRQAGSLLLLVLSGCRSHPAETPVKELSHDEASQAPSTPSALVSYFEGGHFRRLTAPASNVVRVDVSRLNTFDGPPSFALLVDQKLPPGSVGPPPGQVALAKFSGPVLATDSRVDLVAHDVSFSSSVSKTKSARLDIRLTPQDRVFGLGDKAKGTNRRGHGYEFWNTDAFGYGGDTDPLYKSIPFVLVLNEDRAFGVFVDTTARGTVDVGKRDSQTLSFEFAETSTLSTYVFTGSPREILDAYTELTGRTPLPPLWALGYHQSRYGYLTEEEVRGVVDRFVEERLPLDAIWLDIDFQQGNAPFTVNRGAFPHFDDMIDTFEAQHIRTVVITDPHIKSYQDAPSKSAYAPYESGARGDHFIRSQGGFFEGEVWPGKSVFPEFTLSRTRLWWGTLYKRFVQSKVHGFWNDMNEPALFVEDKTMPLSVRHRLDDGTELPHALLHNAYGLLNARSTYEGIVRLRPNERPFILTRAASAGTQRYAASWTGDNTANREHLALSIAQLNNLGVSGYAFVGADVGGFIGCPDRNLLVDWMELGAYQPFFRNHSQKESCRREPWVLDQASLDRMRQALQRRYELLPYLYTVFEESSRTGAPVVRPLWFDFPHDAGSLDAEGVFLLGEDLLIAAELEEGSEPFAFYLPPGEWIERSSNERYRGARTIRLPRRGLSSVHEFARAGSIIPQTLPLTSSDGLVGAPLILHIYPDRACQGTVYSDDGRTMHYRTEQGRRRLHLSCQVAPGILTVKSRSTGTGPAFWKNVTVVIHDPSQTYRTARLIEDTAEQTAVSLTSKEGLTAAELAGNRTDFSLLFEL